MKPPYPSLTPTWHNDIYSTIEYGNPKVSQQGRTVIITGAGGGIGRETAIGYASAGAKHLVLLGTTESKLKESEAEALKANPNTKISVYVADVTDEAALIKIANEVGTWDAIVYSAGWMATPSPAAKSDIGDFWKSYEINVKGIIVTVKAFLPTANPSHAAFIAMVSAGCIFPAQMLVGYAGYQVAKLAAAKTIEILAQENPSVFFAAVHPGMVETDMFHKSGYTTDMLAMDNVKLSAGFNLWVTLPEAKFLTGRFVWANWDIDELKGLQGEITGGNKLTFGYEGWPFPNM